MNRKLNPTMASILMILCVMLLSAGCSSDRGTGPALSRVNGPEIGTSSQSSQGPEPLAQAGSIGSSPSGQAPSQAGSLSGSKDVDGSVGGTVSVGRITVTFSPGAFSGTKTITIYDTSDNGVSCELYPEGLQFSQPVTLQMQLDGTSLDDNTATVDWYNTSSSTWVDITGTYQASNHAVTATLQHFSDYRGNRAGW